MIHDEHDIEECQELSEIEQEREVLDRFVGSATAEDADGHAGSAFAQTQFVDDCHCFSIRMYGYDVYDLLAGCVVTRGCKHQRNAARL